jgi:hypothetical protein
MKNPAIFSGITNTKLATVLATMGLPLRKHGVYITYDKENPKSSGGTAHFLFEDSIQNRVGKLSEIYNEGKADEDLDNYLEVLKATMPPAAFEELESKITDALIVYGRKFLDNYQIFVKSLKSDIAKYVVTGGTPVFDSLGNYAGIKDFTLRSVK